MWDIDTLLFLIMLFYLLYTVFLSGVRLTIDLNGVSEECLKAKKCLNEFKKSRNLVIEEIRQIAATVRKRQENVNISKITGSALAVTGGIMGIAGMGLTIATFGAASPLVMAGVAIAGAGGVAATGAGIVLSVKEHFEKEEVKKLLKTDEERKNILFKKLTKLDQSIAEQVCLDITKQEFGKKIGEEHVNMLNKYVTERLEDLLNETSAPLHEAFISAGGIKDKLKRMVEKIKETLKRKACQEHELAPVSGNALVSSPGVDGSDQSVVSTLRTQITKIETLLSLTVQNMKILSSENADEKIKKETTNDIVKCIEEIVNEVRHLLKCINQCKPCDVIALGVIYMMRGFPFFLTLNLFQGSVAIMACIANLSLRTATTAIGTRAANASRTAGGPARLAFPPAGIIFSSALLAVDISILVKTSIEVHKGSPSEVADMLEQQARGLEESLQDLELNIDKMFQRMKKNVNGQYVIHF